MPKGMTERGNTLSDLALLGHLPQWGRQGGEFVIAHESIISPFINYRQIVYI